ncbi:MAG: ATP-binding protein [Actinomycetes bacterium]
MTTVGVTIVITDLVGSTALTTRVGAEEIDRLRREHFALLRAAIEAAGGREVKNTGDGIMAAFGGVGAALDASVAMQQACARRNVGATEPLEIRVGIGTGDCTEEDGDYFGEPPTVAARLCGEAEPGEILAPDFVRLLAPRGRHEFVDAGERALKGLPDPVTTVTVVWAAPDTATDVPVPLPARLAGRAALPYAGRDAERASIAAAARAAAAGSRRIVLTSGEAGQGKNRLVAECARAAHTEGALVLYGRCEEDLVRQYAPWAEAIEFLGAHVAPEHLEGLDLRALVRVAPGLRSRVGEAGATDGSTADEFVVFAAVTDLLTRVATIAPVVVVLVDLHWADRGTLLLLRHVVGATAAERILILGTFRDTDVDPEGLLAGTLAALHREDGVSRITLEGLAESDLGDLLAVTAGHDLGADGDALARTLRAETNGNPFFVVEMLRHLVESGAIAQDAAGRWGATINLAAVGMPQSVREVVVARVRRLGEVAGQCLTAAAVCGRDFDLRTVAWVVDRPEDDVLDAFEAAVAAGLVAEVPTRAERFTFAHALVQQALGAELSPTRRARLHAAIADAIAAEPDAVSRSAEVARHLLAAGRPEDRARAVPYAIRAGDDAVEGLAAVDGVRWYRAALDLLGPEADRAERCDLEIRLGNAERRADDLEFLPRLIAAAAEARALGRNDLLVAAALARYRGFQISGAEVDPEQLALLEGALAVVGEEDSPARARLVAAIASELRFSGDPTYVDRSRESIAVARRTGDRATLVDVLAWSSLDTPASFDERRAVAEEVMRLTEGYDDPMRRFWALVQVLTTWLTIGDIHAARSAAAELMTAATRLGNPQTRWIATLWAVQIATTTGDLAEAERLTNEAFALSLDAGRQDGMLYTGSQLMSIRLQQGRTAELLPLIEQAVVTYPRIPGFRSVLAFAAARSGDLDLARSRFAELAATAFSFPEDQVWMTATTLAAHTAHLLDDGAAATVLLPRLEPYGDRIGVQTLSANVGAVSHHLGLLRMTLGDLERAEADLVDALERNTRLESPHYRAQTMLALARLGRDRDPQRAAGLAAEAAAIAARYGFAQIAMEAAALAG